MKLNPFNFNELAKQACTELQAGNLVICPTETVYGLLADASNPKAVERVFAAKGRSNDKPLSIFLTAASELKEWSQPSEQALELAKQYWPGPLTLVMPKSEKVSDAVTAGKNSVGIRIPNHPFALEVLKLFGRPMVATSANLSGEPNPSSPAEMAPELLSHIALVIEDENYQSALASTVVDMTGDDPVILRQGEIKL
jgi:L-threonylcarbamoyladenylate synthase